LKNELADTNDSIILGCGDCAAAFAAVFSEAETSGKGCLQHSALEASSTGPSGKRTFSEAQAQYFAFTSDADACCDADGSCGAGFIPAFTKDKQVCFADR
jgi:hypothetical protein